MEISLIAGKATPRVTGSQRYLRRMAAGLKVLGHALTDGTVPAAGSIFLVDGAALADLPSASMEAAIAFVQGPVSHQDATHLRAVRRVIVPSEHTAARLVADCGVPSSKIAVVAPGTDDQPRSTGSAGPTCEILAVAPLRPDKGQDILLRSLCRLFDLDWHLTIAGDMVDPAYGEHLRALAEELGIARQVSFVTDPPPEAEQALWQGADLFALTPHTGEYGMVFAEALRRGLPVAATSVGAVQAFVGPDAGVVCAPGDIDQLAKALRRLIFDAPLRRDTAEVAWQTGQTLPSWDEQAARLADLLAAPLFNPASTGSA